jgi:hypothetical protein
MGRELKRVSIDFEWPIRKTWDGYINDAYRSYKRCKCCDGSGFSEEANAIDLKWYGFAPFDPVAHGSTPFTPNDSFVQSLVRERMLNQSGYLDGNEYAVKKEVERLCGHWNDHWCYHLNENDIAAVIADNGLIEFTCNWTKEKGWVKKEVEYIPTPLEVNRASITGMINLSEYRFSCVKAEAEKRGVPLFCHECDGHGNVWTSEEDKLAAEKWVRTEPPAGDGYQIWETVSEGSPISPVFAEPMELAKWMSENRNDTVDKNTSAEQWMQFIMGDGWAPSMVISGGKMMTGVEAVSLKNKESV